jgi:FkbH-like protein
MSLEDIIRDLDGTPASYSRISRLIGEGDFEELSPVNVAILSTFTLDLVRPYLVVETARRGMLIDPFFAPFNQLEQQVLDPQSLFYKAEPEVVVIAARLEEWAPSIVEHFVSMTPENVESELDRIEGRARDLIEGIRRYSQATVLFFNFVPPDYLSAGLADAGLETSQTSAVQQANHRISQVCRAFGGVFIFDYYRMVQESGQHCWVDPKLWYLGRIPMGTEAQIQTGRRLSRYIRASRYPSSKCLVVDLDNTLWGGVLGEEGLGGISIGEEYPGNVYKAFQRHLVSLRDRGVLLAIASKNNETDVVEAFEKHSDFVLKLADFAARQVHWHDKASSLKTIAAELNIGTDSLAFFDDSPVEREWVRSQLPEVTVIDVPDDPTGYADALEMSGAFDILTVTQEDRQRPEMYRNESQRKQLRHENISPEEFLRQLEITATIGLLNADTLPRAAQLMAKTNQFNLTNRRHTVPDIQTMTASGAVGLWMRLNDRFGDNGLVAVAIAIPESASDWKVDTFLMSCRVAGRQAESALLGVMCDMVRKRGGQMVTGEYISTSKNGMVSEFYESNGFQSMDSEGRLWQWDFSNGNLSLPDFISINIEGDD